MTTEAGRVYFKKVAPNGAALDLHGEETMRVTELLAYDSRSACDDPQIREIAAQCCRDSKLETDDVEINNVPGERLIDFHSNLTKARMSLQGKRSSSA